MISPTNGRIVWFYPVPGDTRIIQHDPSKPLAAIVCCVWNDRMINLHVIDNNGASHPKTSVKLLQDDDTAPSGEAYAVWMPYQIGAAKRASYEATPRSAGSGTSAEPR